MREHVKPELVNGALSQEGPASAPSLPCCQHQLQAESRRQRCASSLRVGHTGLGRQEIRPWARLSFPQSAWRSPGKTCVAELHSNARGFCEGGRRRSAGQPGATKARGLAGDCSVQGSRVSV